MEKKRSLLKFDEAWYVPPERRASGLALWWTGEVIVNIINSSKNLIHTKVESANHKLPEYISFVYGPPIEKDRMPLWNRLRGIASNMSGTWLCVGDFNELLSQSEKLGGNPYVLRRVVNFQSFVSDCELLEIEAKGARYTWCNQRLDDAHVKERFDRALGNIPFRDEFQKALVVHREPLDSDHHLLLLKLCFEGIKSPRAFKFEALWVTHPEFLPLMNKCWRVEVAESSTAVVSFLRHLNFCRAELIKWSKICFPNNRKVIDNLSKQIEILKTNIYTDNIVLQIE